MTLAIDESMDMKAGSRGRGKGRKNRDGGSEAMDVNAFNEGAKDGMKLYKKLELARADFNAWASGIAEKSNIQTSTASKIIKASATGKFKDVQRILDQQAAFFELVGEVQASDAVN